VEKLELHRVDLAVGASTHKVFGKLDISIGVTADIEGNDSEFIFGGKYGYGLCNKQTGEYRWIKKVWSNEEVADGKPDRMRGNDGSVDPRGRFWVGFMNDPMVKEPTDEGMYLIASHLALRNLERDENNTS
jgi:sugar lactone lactonase YvrE